MKRFKHILVGVDLAQADVLVSDASEHVRARAAHSLAAIGDEHAWDTVVSRLGDESSEVVLLAIRQAGRSLGR